MSEKSIKNLSLEPYRLFFLGGSLYAVLAVALWFTWLHLQDHGIAWFDFQVGPAQFHSHVMLFGVMGFYVFGFILTAFPRFVGQEHPAPKTVTAWFAGLLGGQICFFLGATHSRSWMAAAWVLEGLSYLTLLAYLSRLYFRSGKWREDKQPRFLLLALGFGTLGVILSYFYYAVGGSFTFYTLSIEFGTYGYLFLLVVAITYRIVPFFAGKVIQGYEGRRGTHTLAIVTTLILLRILLVTLWADTPRQYYASWLINLALLAALAVEWCRWKPWQAKKTPILFILFLGLFWILVFLGFSGYELLYHLIERSGEVYPVLRTPALHALYIGAFGTLVLAVSTRVVRGHGGAPIVADRFTLAALLLMEVAALWRVFAPVFFGSTGKLWLRNYWAGLFWCAAFGVWALRYIPFLFRPKSPDAN
ncbi:MAG: NnrS family protein [Deltaproteobacteria bacterium]|nr:NnrS family protein [Deltaproteobacteria bacterium]